MEPPEKLQRLRWQIPEVEDIRLHNRGRTFSFLIILFLLIVFATLLFFYACWIRRSRTAQSTTSHDDPPGRHRRRSQQPLSRGLGISAIDGIPVILAGIDDGLKCKECCICLGGFEDGEKLKVLPRCSHAFHGECVDRWLRSESTCPMCRASLGDESNSDSIKIVVTEL